MPKSRLENFEDGTDYIWYDKEYSLPQEVHPLTFHWEDTELTVRANCIDKYARSLLYVPVVSRW